MIFTVFCLIKKKKLINNEEAKALKRTEGRELFYEKLSCEFVFKLAGVCLV